MTSERKQELNTAYERLSKLIGKRQDTKARQLMSEIARFSRGELDHITAGLMND